MRVALSIDQLGVDANPVAQPADAAFEHITHPKLAPDLLGLDPLSLIGECGIARDHKHVRDARQIGRQILGDPICKVLLLRVVAESDAHLWAERFDRDIDDLFALQDEITTRIAIALNVELIAAEAARPSEISTRSTSFSAGGPHS